jgi:hypothetical protein
MCSSLPRWAGQARHIPADASPPPLPLSPPPLHQLQFPFSHLFFLLGFSGGGDSCGEAAGRWQWWHWASGACSSGSWPLLRC